MEILRNITGLDDFERPAVALNDGMEEPLVSQVSDPLAPLTMKMRVSVLVFLKSDLAAWRRKIIYAVSSGSGVRAAYGKPGALHYDGCEVGFSTAERVNVDLAVYFEVTYELRPGNLETTDRREAILDAVATALEGITPP